MFSDWIRKKSEEKNSEIKEKPTLKIEDFPKIFSGKMIELIVQEEKETKREYVGGNFHINYIDEKNHYFSYELYFQDAEEEIYKTEGKSKALSNEKLFPEARKELAEEKIITFEIPEPSKAERDVYSGDFSAKDLLKDIFDAISSKK